MILSDFESPAYSGCPIPAEIEELSQAAEYIILRWLYRTYKEGDLSITEAAAHKKEMYQALSEESRFRPILAVYATQAMERYSTTQEEGDKQEAKILAACLADLEKPGVLSDGSKKNLLCKVREYEQWFYIPANKKLIYKREN